MDSPSTSSDNNPRKRGRTACTRCKTRKQKCDNEYPVCSNCRKANVECDKSLVSRHRESSPGYTRALEERIAYLEGRLSEFESRPRDEPSVSFRQSQTPISPQATTRRTTSNPLGEIVGFLTVGSSLDAPAYVGSSSGLSLAVNLGEMVQATVWNNVLPPSSDPSRKASGGPKDVNGAAISSEKGGPSVINRPARMEDLTANAAEPPNEEMGARILKAYINRLHPRYPFLDRKELWALHEKRFSLSGIPHERLSKAEKFGLFKLYLVYSIGATMMQLSEKYNYTAPERFYMTALRHMCAVQELRSIQNIEAMALLVIYHLRSASSHGVWYMIGLAMRICIDLGLHRKANLVNLDPFTAQMRRRLFWSVYYLERVIAVSLGRPPSIPDSHIDLELPLNVNDDEHDPAVLTSQPPAGLKTTLTFSICLFQLRQIDSKIQHSIYRADRALHTLRPKLDRLYLELEEWKSSATSCFSNSELDYPMLHYNRAVRLLIQPFLPLLSLSDPYYHICLRAAGEICQVHKRLHQTLEYGHSFLAVQTVFVAGITLLYALWTHTDRVWSVQMSNDIRACSTVLFVMGERAGWVKKYRDAFELLINAAMEKLQGDEALRALGMAQMMVAQHGGGDFSRMSNTMPNSENVSQSDIGATYTSQAMPASGIPDMPGGTDGAMRMAMELAPWLDQGNNVPLWMPDFETLENLTSGP
ncbi:transcriptional regulator family: Fungal Specific TF [Paecilomyces variotii]|nr:transcriptional regulator family: Fungal Specific TF [Paecilomyces variotii]